MRRVAGWSRASVLCIRRRGSWSGGDMNRLANLQLGRLDRGVGVHLRGVEVQLLSQTRPVRWDCSAMASKKRRKTARPRRWRIRVRPEWSGSGSMSPGLGPSARPVQLGGPEAPAVPRGHHSTSGRGLTRPGPVLYPYSRSHSEVLRAETIGPPARRKQSCYVGRGNRHPGRRG